VRGSLSSWLSVILQVSQNFSHQKQISAADTQYPSVPHTPAPKEHPMSLFIAAYPSHVQVAKYYCPQINAAMFIVAGGWDLERRWGRGAINRIHAVSAWSVRIEWPPQITSSAPI